MRVYIYCYYDIISRADQERETKNDNKATQTKNKNRDIMVADGKFDGKGG
jgi:hypothetical protein